MLLEKLCYVGIYQGYLVAVSGGYWEIMCSRYYYMADGQAGDRTEAENAARARVDSWLDRVKK